MTLALALPEFGFSISALLSGVVMYAYYVLFGFIIASILLSWLPGYPSSSFMQAVYETVGNVTRPILGPIRSAIPPLRLGALSLDLSPIIAIFGLFIGRSLLLLIIQNFLQPVTG
ncbi:MAG: YggT family protein [Rubrobacteraceae bacterium]